MRVLRVIVMVAVALMLGLPACSSGGGGAASGLRDHVAVIDEIATKMEALFEASPDATPEDLVALVDGRPEFEETGVEDENAWARFTDGQLLLLAADPRRGGATVRTQSSALSADAPPFQLPGGDRAVVLDAMGTWFATAGAQIQSWLYNGGYSITNGVGTVEQLRAISGASVLFFETHGVRGRSRVTRQSVFALWTATKVSPEGEALYKEELADVTLGRMLAKHDAGPRGPTVERHYAITSKFIRKYMSFAPDAFVYVDACSSADADLVEAMLDTGASLYAGWTRGSYDAGTLTSRFVFDGLLGANQYEPKEDPPQRPFNWVEVADEAMRRKLDRQLDSLLVFTQRPVLDPTSVGFGLLAPSIKRVLVRDTDMLLEGTFGATPGKATIGGAEVACAEWASTYAVCSLPRSGAGSEGDVVLSVDNRPSNARQITEWTGTFTSTEIYTCGYDGPRNLVAKIRWNVRIRADIGTFREHPGEAPVAVPVEFALEPDTTMTAEASGTCNYVGLGFPCRDVWSGSSAFPYATGHNYGVIDPIKRRLAIRLYYDLPTDLLNQKTYCSGELEFDGGLNLAWGVGGDGFQDGEEPGAGPAFYIALDDAWNGIAGQRTHAAATHYDAERTVSWTTLRASNPPDPRAPR